MTAFTAVCCHSWGPALSFGYVCKAFFLTFSHLLFLFFQVAKSDRVWLEKVRSLQVKMDWICFREQGQEGRSLFINIIYMLLKEKEQNV